jgi:N4-gp56 family major capsid protein
MADNTTSTLTGAIQKYLVKKLLAEKDFKTPLANSSNAVEGTISQKNGQYVEYRWFDDLALPDYVNEGSDPASGQNLVDHILQAPLKEIADWIDFTNLLLATDWVNNLDRAYDALKKALRRKCHRVTQEALLVTSTASKYGISFTNTKCPTIYAGNKSSFGALGNGDFISMADFIRARTRLLNSRVPAFDGGFFHAVVDGGTLEGLQDDSQFLEIVKRHESLVKKSVIPGHICDFRGIRFIQQDEPFRETLGGTEGTRVETGEVVTAHMFGKECFGYLGLSGMNAKAPKFKVQDISKTGCQPTCGYRVTYTAHTLQHGNGLNIKGTRKYNEENA